MTGARKWVRRKRAMAVTIGRDRVTWSRAEHREAAVVWTIGRLLPGVASSYGMSSPHPLSAAGSEHWP